VALPDDLNQLAQLDVLYLTLTIGGGSTTIFRGRLHQALSGNWVFNTSTGQNGVAGIDLGQPTPNWSSTTNPKSGLVITIGNPIISSQTVSLTEIIMLTSVIPEDLAD
jgi:hypothetical protein